MEFDERKCVEALNVTNTYENLNLRIPEL